MVGVARMAVGSLSPVPRRGRWVTGSVLDQVPKRPLASHLTSTRATLLTIPWHVTAASVW
jgi:hypothetical protein